MALRKIVLQGEPCLTKVCRPVTDFNARLHQLLDDMADTLAEANGVGLAAPQVGILRRAVLVLETNVPEGEDEYVIELINPEIIETSGEQDGPEGCLSVPGEYGLVILRCSEERQQELEGCLSVPGVWAVTDRPMTVTVRAMNRKGEYFSISGSGLTARCFCHEIDHLEGILFTEKCERMLTEEEMSNGEY